MDNEYSRINTKTQSYCGEPKCNTIGKNEAQLSICHVVDIEVRNHSCRSWHQAHQSCVVHDVCGLLIEDLKLSAAQETRTSLKYLSSLLILLVQGKPQECSIPMNQERSQYPQTGTIIEIN